MRLIFVFLLAVQVALLLGCDKGRVIDQNEREKVLYKEGNDKTDFAHNLQIYADQMTPQSEYRFVIYNAQASTYIPVTLTSLLKFEGNQSPQLQFLDRKVDMTCKQRSAAACILWGYTFDLRSLSSGAPNMSFEIQMSPLKKYSLKSKVGDAYVHMADYDTYLLTFDWVDIRFAYIVAKQNFYVDADLIKSPMGSNVNENFAYLFAAAYYWPSPSYLLTLQRTEDISNAPNSMEFYGVYQNVKTLETSKVHYRLEAL